MGELLTTANFLVQVAVGVDLLLAQMALTALVVVAEVLTTPRSHMLAGQAVNSFIN
jgi:hypothetical protein